MAKSMHMVYSIGRGLITKQQLAERVKEMAKQISEDYAERAATEPIIFICILKGAYTFCAHLMDDITIPCEVHFLDVSSYDGGTKTTGVVKIEKDISVDITGRHVVIIEDIVDTGLTINHLLGFFEHREPTTLATCTLLDKPEARQVEVPLKYVGFEIPNEFVVGFGLDYKEQFRNLPSIMVLSPEVYNDSEG